MFEFFEGYILKNPPFRKFSCRVSLRSSLYFGCIFWSFSKTCLLLRDIWLYWLVYWVTEVDCWAPWLLSIWEFFWFEPPLFVLVIFDLVWYDFALMIFLALYFILFKFSLLRSNFFKHIRFIASTKRPCLILRSIGESHAKDGDKLTSMSQGFKSSSIKTSKPKSSKQLLLEFIFFNCEWTTPSTEIRDLIITSYILDHKRSLSIPICSNCLVRAYKLHLWPSSPWSAFWF